MIVINNREAVDKSLNDTTTTIFMIIGPAESEAGAVHALIEAKKWEAYQRWFLFPNADLLSPDELKAWFNDKTSQWYAVLGGEELPKTIAQKGPIKDLLKSNGKPDYLAIRDIFLAGDEV